MPLYFIHYILKATRRYQNATIWEILNLICVAGYYSTLIILFLDNSLQHIDALSQ